MQKEAEIAATLETGRKEGYHLGHQKRLEAVKKQVEIVEMDTSNCDTVTRPTTVLLTAPVIHAPREMSALHSGSQNPWGSLSR